jgi:two-component system chemotaxis response regulator CheB
MDTAMKKITDLDRFKAVAIGASAGGIDALEKILPRFPKTYPLPIMIVLHIPGDQPSLLAEIFASKTELRVKDADEKETLRPGTVYFASPGYHLLVERDLTFSLSQEDPVQYARPSIDVLFESAADAFGPHLVGVLLTGANQDGAIGLNRIQKLGGLALIQDPATAQARAMPEAACKLLAASAEQILSLDEIASLLLRLKAAPKGEAITGTKPGTDAL